MLTALWADKQGNIFDAPGYEAVGRNGRDAYRLQPADVIPAPEGTEVMYLPDRPAMGARGGRILPVGGGRLAVAAVLPAGYTRLYLPAYRPGRTAPILPLYGYTAAALYRDALYVAAVRSDDNSKWNPLRYNTGDLKRRVRAVQRELGGNRIVGQLAHCSLTWHCCTAQNLFYRRWEAGIPVSPACNANCLGCISRQPAECCPSPQDRLAFTPTPGEIAAVGCYHLQTAPEAIISFGQGCEGEPALAAEVIAAGIRQIRAVTDRGLINMNTNAGYTAGIKTIVDSGLDSLRVSIISARPEVYQAYYRGNYTLDDVRRSISYAKQRGRYVSLNFLLFPGFNDRPEEIEAWERFIPAVGIDLVQLRNLNLDPEIFLAAMPPAEQKPRGVRYLLTRLAAAAPNLRLGSFSRYFK